MPPPTFRKFIRFWWRLPSLKASQKRRLPHWRQAKPEGYIRGKEVCLGQRWTIVFFFISEIITLWCQAKQALRILPSSRLTTILILCLRALFMHQTANDVVLYRSHLFFFLFPWLPHLQPPLIVHWKTRWSDKNRKKSNSLTSVVQKTKRQMGSNERGKEIKENSIGWDQWSRRRTFTIRWGSDRGPWPPWAVSPARPPCLLQANQLQSWENLCIFLYLSSSL